MGWAVVFVPTAWAQSPEIITTGRLVIVAGGADVRLGARAAAYVDATWTADSGLQGGFSLGAAAVSDNAGRYQIGPAGAARAPITGLGGLGQAREEAKAALVAGYGFVRGGWGEASLGRDQGATERFSLTLPTAFAALNPADGALDPSGGAAIRLVNAPSGAGAKVTATSVRLVGLTAGVSYAPREDSDELGQGLGPGRARLDDIWETGVSFARTTRAGLKIEAGLTHARARTQANGAGFGDLASSGAALRVGQGAWTLGVAGLTSDNGRRDARDYAAFGVSGVWASGPWMAMAGGARADDSWTASRQERTMFGVSRAVGNRAKFGLAATWDRRKVNAPLGLKVSEGGALLAEISVEL